MTLYNRRSAQHGRLFDPRHSSARKIEGICCRDDIHHGRIATKAWDNAYDYRSFRQNGGSRFNDGRYA
jgi:hypothetical protein